MSDSPDYLDDFYCCTTDLSRYSLPTQLTSFLGRERELSEVKQLLLTSRIVTLTGVGGVGKTRLALQVAHELKYQHELFHDRLWFVSVAHLHDPVEILPALTQSLGLRKEPEPAQLSALYVFLHAKRALLILDGCEHLIEVCARWVETLLNALPDLFILATSRETFGINGETISYLAPLSVPSPSAILTSEDLVHYSATALFLERARAAHPSFHITARNTSALVEICQHLDGLPLAIELAANRMRMMSVEQIAEQVRDKAEGRFTLLSGGSRTSLHHQQSLRATLDWSFHLLNAAEQRLLLRLAVFSGGWTLEAAQAVCADTDTDDPSILDRLAHLVNTSLILVDRQPVVQTLPTGEAQLVEQGRYTFLETVQLYALEKFLESDEAQTVRHKHLAYFLSLAEKAEPELRGASQLPWLTYLDIEHENLRGALEYARQEQLYKMGLHLANALWWFWILRANFSAGRAWLEEIVLSEEKLTPALRALALYRAGILAFFQGDLERLDMLTEKSLAIFSILNDMQGIAVAQSSLVHVALRQGNNERAQYLGTESVALARTVGDRWYLALTLLPLAVLKIRLKDYISAGTLLKEALMLFHALEDRWGIAYAFDALGQLADAQRDYVSSIACYEQSLKLFEQLNDQIGTARALLHLGFHLLEQEKYTQASSALEESLGFCRASERRIGVARALLGLGRIKLHFHDYEEGALLLEESLDVFRDHGDVRGFAEALMSLQEIAPHQDRFQQVRLLLQHSLGRRYHINNAFDMVASLETIAASEMAQTVFAGHMRPAGWLERVIRLLQETRQPAEMEQRVNMSWVKEIVEESRWRATLARAHTLEKEPTMTFLPQGIPASDASLVSERVVPAIVLQTQKQRLPKQANGLTNREQDLGEACCSCPNEPISPFN